MKSASRTSSAKEISWTPKRSKARLRVSRASRYASFTRSAAWLRKACCPMTCRRTVPLSRSTGSSAASVSWTTLRTTSLSSR